MLIKSGLLKNILVSIWSNQHSLHVLQWMNPFIDSFTVTFKDERWLQWFTWLSLTKRLSFCFLVSLQLRSAYWWHNKVSLASCKQFRHFLHSIFTHKGQQFLFVFVLLKYLVSSERRACQESWTQGGRSQSMEGYKQLSWPIAFVLSWYC